ncbi:hypothetical protein Tco_1550906, partial [Tanacetum coccineum]
DLEMVVDQWEIVVESAGNMVVRRGVWIIGCKDPHHSFLLSKVSNEVVCVDMKFPGTKGCIYRFRNT